MIRIELEKNELNEIQSKQLHWSNLFDFDAIISFDYGEQKVHFETMHHLMTLGDLTKGIIVLLRSGKQSSYSGYGASYNKKLIIKRVKDRAFIELHIKKGDFISVEVNPKVLALDFLRAIKNHIDYISSFQYDHIGAEELEGINLLIIIKTNDQRCLVKGEKLFKVFFIFQSDYYTDRNIERFILKNPNC